MSAAILSIGTELTRGELTNTNASWLAERLTALGLDVVEQATTADDSERIGATLTRFGGEVKVVLVTGGLGPTSDDITAAATAQALGVGLVQDAGALARIEARYAATGKQMPASNRKQAELPEGSTVLANDQGTAPGFAVTVGQARCYFMPGVPSEMRHIFETHVEPELSAHFEQTTHQVHMRTFGLRESEIADRLAELEQSVAAQGVVFGYRARVPEIEVKVLARMPRADAARELAERVADEVRERLGPAVYGGRDDTFAGVVGEGLRARGWGLAVAESCTGGLIGKLLTDVAGSSDYLRFDAVTYSNQAKSDLLGVSAALIDKQGAVSSEVAAAMADGALQKAAAEIAVAVTGIAGPGGGSADKPVGTVWFGLAREGATTITKKHVFPGDRDRVRLQAAYTALNLVRQNLTAEGAVSRGSA